MSAAAGTDGAGRYGRAAGGGRETRGGRGLRPGDRLPWEPADASRARRPDPQALHADRPAGRRHAPAHAAPARAWAEAPRASGRRVAALDGLRALAIASVVLYHLGAGWLPSGHLGVAMFLVLTGYLVTCSLMRAWERTGSVSPARFLVRRFRRIWPSMAVLVAVVLAVCVAANHILLTKGRPDAVPSLLFFLNWHYVASGASYFDQIGGPSPLTHLWYLSVDAQFCLVWALVCWAVMRHGDHRVALRRAALAGAVVSSVAMGVLFVPGADPSRVYYGLDTRAFSLLAGAWLGLALPLGTLPARARGLLWEIRSAAHVRGRGAHAAPGVLRAAPSSPAAPATSATAAARLLGPACLSALVLIMVLAPSASAFMFRGGMALAALLTVGLAASLLVPGTPLGRLLGTRPVVWLGERAFALYLWHYPVFVLADAPSGAWWVQLLCAAASLGLAELSLRLVERPFADGRAASAARELLAWLRPGTRARADVGRAATAAAAAVVCVVVSGTALAGSLTVPDEFLVPPDAIRNTGDAVDSGMDLTARIQAARSAASSAAPEADAQPMPAQLPDPQGSITLHAAAAERAASLLDPVMIGDSVPGDAQEYFDQHVPDGLLDAYVGRRPDEMLQVLEDYLAQGVVGHVVVLQAFSNNIPTEEELDQMVADCGPDRQVYLVNVRIPEEEEAVINANLAAAAERHDNVHLIDWNGYSQGNEEAWLYPDMTHLQEEGVASYIDLVTNAIAGSVAEAGGTYELEPEAQAAWDAQLQAARQAELDRQQAAEQAMLDMVSSGQGRLLQSAEASAQGVVTPLLIGDSVPGDAPFDEVFADGYMDAYVGRRPEQALSVYQDYAAQGVVGSAVVFACFSNTTPMPDQLDQLVAAVDPAKQVYLVGTVNPEGFQDDANANLQACAEAYDNVHYVDWPAYAAGHEGEWLYEDGTHLTPDGGWGYVSMLLQAVGPQVLAEGGSSEAFQALDQAV